MLPDWLLITASENTNPAEWVNLSQLLEGQNIPFLLGISVLTFIIYRIQVIPDRFGDLVPWTLGAVLGYWQGTANGFSVVGYTVTYALINGGAAWLAAQASIAALKQYQSWMVARKEDK